jgi:hypothetical protein
VAYGSDITDAIPYPLSNPGGGQNYAPTGIAYDIAIAAQPFFLNNTDETPYRRVTAQYRKNQVDMTREPGEQTLTGWWLRSQSTFHYGQGIKFFEPAQDESLRFQYTWSKGCNIWDKGQVTLLNDVDTTHLTTGNLQSNNRPFQIMRSIRYSNKDAVLLWDEYDVDKIEADGTLVHFIDYTSGTDNPVYAICDDGTYAYWVTNRPVGGNQRLSVYKKVLTGNSGTANTLMFQSNTVATSNAVMEYTKERIIMCVNDSIYEFPTNQSSMPTAVYTHKDPDHIFSSITSSGTAIYVSGYSGIQSNIYKFTLNTLGAMPTLTSAITAAELPVGEVVYRIYYYLGYMAIGTSLGLRIAQVSDQDGSIAYGPLLFESEQPVYDVAGYDKYLWCTTNVDGNPGVTRVDLSTQIGGNLVFAYAWDLADTSLTGFLTTSCSFLGNTNRLAFCTANNGAEDGTIFLESADVLVASAELRTGYIRYNTLEDKIFKLMTPRFNTANGGLSIVSIDQNDVEYNLGSYDQGSFIDQVGISYPQGAQQFLGFKFTFTRSTTDNTQGPIFTGYQVNTLPSIPRQRLIQYPIFMYDYEMDKFNNPTGYDGYAFNRLSTMQSIEDIGDLVRVEDFRTGESYLGLIEEMDFINKTPTDKRYSGFGGLLLVTIRTA